MIETQEETKIETNHSRLSHIVRLVDGKPSDKCLCGYIWDVFPANKGSEICEECLRIYEGR